MTSVTIHLDQQFVRSVLDTVGDMITIIDVEGRRLYGNPAYRMLVQDSQQRLRTDIFEDIHPEDRDRFQNFLRDVFANGTGRRIEYRLITGDGSLRTVESLAHLVRDEKESARHVLLISRSLVIDSEVSDPFRWGQTVFSLTADCFCIIDLKNTILFANPRFCSEYQYSSEELLGRNITMVWTSPARSNDDVESVSASPLEKGHYELTGKAKDGTTFPVMAWRCVFHGSKGVPVAVAMCLRRTLSWKATEEPIEGSPGNPWLAVEDKFPSLLLYDPETSELLAANDEATRLFKCTMSQLLSKSIGDISDTLGLPPPCDDPRTPDGQTPAREMRKHRSKMDPLLEVEISDAGIEIKGRQARLVMVRRAAFAGNGRPWFRVNEELLQSVIEHSTDGLMMLDASGVITFTGPSSERILGYKYHEFVGRNAFEFVHPDDLSRLEEMFEHLVRQEGGVLQSEFRLKVKDGTWKWFEGVGNNLLGDPHVGSVVANFRDISERKLAETSLRESEHRLRTLVANVPIILFAIDRTGIFTLSEGKGLAALGLKAGEVVGHSVYEIYRDQPAILTNIRRALAGESFAAIVELGTLVYEVYYNPVYGRDRHVSGLIGVAVDMSEHRRSQQERQAMFEITESVNQTADLEALLARIHQSLKNVVYAENCFVALYNRNDGMLHKAFYVDLVDPPFPPQKLGKSCTAYVFRTGRPILMTSEVFRDLVDKGEVELIGADSPSWLGVPLKTATETIGVLVVQHYDDPGAYTQRDLEFLESVGHQIAIAIERKRTDVALRLSEEKYRTLFEESQDGIFITTPDGKVVDANPKVMEIFGYDSMEEFLGVEIGHDLYFNSQDREIFKRQLERQGFVSDFENIIRRKDGERRVVLESASAVRDESGNVVAYRGFIRDITERKTLEDQLRQSQKMEGIGTLAGGIAHDFNNLLGIILGYTALIEKGSLTEQKFHHCVDTIKNAVDRGAGLVRQLLTFARKADPTFESISANTGVMELAKMLKQTFPKTIEIRLELHDSLPCIVADSSQLHQALLNLCVNSRDAILEARGSSGRGIIRLITGVVSGETLRHTYSNAAADEYVVIQVQDDGAGMDEATRKRVFEPFFTTKGLGKGTGLGLAVVYGVVNSHHGFIDVESDPGRGTTFSLYLPVQARPVMRSAVEEIEKLPVSSGTETILLVEDEEMLLELLRNLLEERGYKILVAHDGIEALEIYTPNFREIALVLSDMGLPRLGGWEMFQKMKEVNPEVKVILASGYFDADLKMDMLKAGAKDFVQKPYVSDIILKRIREVLEGVSESS